MSSFSLDLSKFVRKADVKMDDVVRTIVFEVGKRVVYRTPVGDADYWQSPAPDGYVGGRARGSWQHGTSLTPESSNVYDENGSGAIAAIYSSIPKKAAGKTHYIMSNIPYGQRLETGWSNQAPNGMIAVTAAEFGQIVRGAAK